MRREGLHRAAHTAHQPPAADRDEDRFDLGAIPDDLEAHRTVPNPDVAIRPWVNERVRLAFPKTLLEKSKNLDHGHEDRFAAVSTDGVDLGGRSRIRHDAARGHTEVSGDPREGLSRVAGTHRTQSSGSIVRSKGRDGIEHAADLERRDGLVNLELEQDVIAPVETVKRDERRMHRDVGQTLGRVFDFGNGGWLGHSAVLGLSQGSRGR